MCSYHSSLRRLLSSTCRSLTGLVRVLLSLSDVQSEEISRQQFDAVTARPDWQQIGNIVEPYMASFSPYCCSLITDEISRVASELYSVTEVCIILQLCMEYEVKGARPRGRPKKTWREILEKTIRHVD